MTTDTSREAVQALIESYRSRIRANALTAPSGQLNRWAETADVLAALLDERDGALAGATTLPHEAAMAGTAGEFAARWNSYRPEKREQAWAGIRAGLDRGNACFTGMHDGRIRDLEAEVKSLDNFLHLEREAAKQNLERAERAEAELLHARGISEIRGAERDKLAAKLDAVKAAVERCTEDRLGERMQSTPVVAKATIRALLADTDEGKDSITFNTDDLGPATDIDGNPLADTDEGSEQ